MPSSELFRDESSSSSAAAAEWLDSALFRRGLLPEPGCVEAAAAGSGGSSDLGHEALEDGEGKESAAEDEGGLGVDRVLSRAGSPGLPPSPWLDRLERAVVAALLHHLAAPPPPPAAPATGGAWLPEKLLQARPPTRALLTPWRCAAYLTPPLLRLNR